MWKVAPLLVILGLNYITGKLKLMYVVRIKQCQYIFISSKKKILKQAFEIMYCYVQIMRYKYYDYTVF